MNEKIINLKLRDLHIIKLKYVNEGYRESNSNPLLSDPKWLPTLFKHS